MGKMIQGRGIAKGIAKGIALVTSEPISFLGGIDPTRAVVVESSHELFGSCIAGRVLVFPTGKGSTVGSYVIYQLKKNGVAPAAMINRYSEPIIAVGAIIAGIPLVDQLGEDPTMLIKTGDFVVVNGTDGYVEVFKW